MSDRERWIIYPLLFLALGTSLKSKLTRTLIIDDIQCRSLIVEERIQCRTLIAEERPGQANAPEEAGIRVIIGHMDTTKGEKTGVFLVDPKHRITTVGPVMEKGP